MTVKELIERCYEEIIIYTNIDNDYIDFEDLYKGKREDIPENLLLEKVNCFRAKRKGVIEISISKHDTN